MRVNLAEDAATSDPQRIGVHLALEGAVGESVLRIYVPAVKSPEIATGSSKQAAKAGMSPQLVDVHVDLDAATIHIAATRTLADTNGSGAETDGPPKSAQSKRTIPLTTQAARALAEHRAWQAQMHGLSSVAKNAYVFYGPLTRPQTNDAWRKLRAQVGLGDHLVPHSLRHTYASSLLVAGWPIVRVAALCGHTVDVCARTYAHWAGGTDHEAAAVLERSRREAR